MKRIFLDSDVLLDLMDEREPFYTYIYDVVVKGKEGQVSLWTSSLVIANMYYLLRKNYGDTKTRKYLHLLKQSVQVLAVDDAIVTAALDSPFTDFEDAIQYHTAKRHRMNHLLTRNTRDYKKAEMSVCTPEQFLLL